MRATERAIDVLVAEGVIGGNSVCDLDLRFDRTVAPWRMRVELKPTKRPEVRLTATARANVAQAVRDRWAAQRARKQPPVLAPEKATP